MAIEYKDYYKILGIDRKAEAKAVKSAYRKLARKYHPDVNPSNKDAEAKFKEINEAYEVLSDADKRKKYDQLGANWKQGAEFRPPPGWEQFGGGGFGGSQRGRNGGAEFEFSGTGFSDFFEQIFGGRRGRGGGGFQFDQDDAAERGRDLEADIMVSLEEALKGSVRSISLRRGSGRTAKTETHQVKIPAGVRDGQKLRVGGKGEAGASGGIAGDLYLTIRLSGHPDFRVEGENLFHDLDLAPWEAVLGTSVAVPTLEGKVNIKLPSGTQTGQRLRLRGRGLGKEGARGDLFVVTRVQVPDKISDEDRKLWEQLAKESKFAPRD